MTRTWTGDCCRGGDPGRGCSGRQCKSLAETRLRQDQGISTCSHWFDPVSEYRNWWQMIPNLAGSNDSFKSWPSGNMTIAAMMFFLPMLTDVTKNRSEGKELPLLYCCMCFCVDLRLQPHPHDQPLSYGRMFWNADHISDLCGCKQGVSSKKE